MKHLVPFHSKFNSINLNIIISFNAENILHQIRMH